MGSFNLHDTNTASYSYTTDANNAFASKRRTDAIPDANKGPSAAFNRIVVTQMSIDVAGYSNSGNVNFGVWSSAGTTNYYASGSLTSGLSAVGATSAVPTKSYTIPVADRFALSGDTLYYFGVHNENSGGITVQRNVSNDGVDLGVDEDHANPTSDLAGTTWTPAFRADYSLVGSIDYIYLPSKPTSPAATGGKKQITVTWSPPSSLGDSAITRYYVYYKKTVDSTWTTVNTGSTSLSYSISALEANTSYDVRVAAWNAASDVIGSTSAYSDTVTVLTSPGGPQIWTGTWTGSEVKVRSDSSTWADAEMFVCTSADPVVWTPLA